MTQLTRRKMLAAGSAAGVCSLLNRNTAFAHEAGQRQFSGTYDLFFDHSDGLYRVNSPS